MPELNDLVVLVSLGVLIFIMIFFFAKRQISRFALKSSKSPHVTIGHKAPNALLLEIERRLRRVKEISIEPHLVSPNRRDELKRRAKIDPAFYYYRMQTLDSVTHLYNEIKKCSPGAVKKVGVPLRVFLFEQRQMGCLEGIRLEVIEKFCSSYDHARHNPNLFSKSNYKEFQGILKLLLHYIHNKYKAIQKQRVSDSPTLLSKYSNGSLQKLLPTPTSPNKNSSAFPTKSSFQTKTPTILKPNEIRSRITTKMNTTANMMGRTGPAVVSENIDETLNESMDDVETRAPRNKILPAIKKAVGNIKKNVRNSMQKNSIDTLNDEVPMRNDDDDDYDDDDDDFMRRTINGFPMDQMTNEDYNDNNIIIHNNHNNSNNNINDTLINESMNDASFNTVILAVEVEKDTKNKNNEMDSEATCSGTYTRMVEDTSSYVGSVNMAVDGCDDENGCEGSDDDYINDEGLKSFVTDDNVGGIDGENDGSDDNNGDFCDGNEYILRNKRLK